ncbi:MAG: hypothetical protein HXX09_14740 [Bacteroidetes bacterium]|nr:hypothetical protein [Bacteroidota bacterium]
MGLFNFFNKKTDTIQVRDLVWISHSAKLKGCINLLKEFPEAIIVSWFPETQKIFSNYFSENGIQKEVKLTRTFSLAFKGQMPIIFLEHYPLKSKEVELMRNWDIEKVIILSSLDEPFFENFGSERIIGLMKTMGMKDDEFIENTMISSAIENAQNKIEKKIAFDNAANSSKEWFAKNISVSKS